jgi:hypothetical protein
MVGVHVSPRYFRSREKLSSLFAFTAGLRAGFLTA